MRKTLGVLRGLLMLAGCGRLDADEAAAQEATGSSEAALSVNHPPPTCAETCAKILRTMDRNHCILRCLIKDIPRAEVAQ